MIEQLFPGGAGGGTVDSIQAGTGISVDATDAANPIVSSTVVDTNDAAKVSANDTTAGYLNGKLVAGSNITLTENNDGSNETLTIDAAAGGLTAFVESQNTASPNNFVNASRLLVDAASADADAVLQPKGNGALLAQLPDNTASGGAKRGNRSVDLQLQRNFSYQVVSGANSFAAGQGNSVTNSWSYASGLNNTVTGSRAFAHGESNNVSGYQSWAFGASNQVQGWYSLAVGEANQIGSFARNSLAIGNFANLTSFGQIAHCVGQTQSSKYLAETTTSGAVTAQLLVGGFSKASGGAMVLPNYRACAYTVFVTAWDININNRYGAWKIEGAIQQHAGTVTLLGTPTVTQLGNTFAGGSVAAVADNTYKALDIQVTGVAGVSIAWNACIEIVSYKW